MGCLDDFTSKTAIGFRREATQLHLGRKEVWRLRSEPDSRNDKAASFTAASDRCPEGKACGMDWGCSIKGSPGVGLLAPQLVSAPGLTEQLGTGQTQ
jgi:hypothetical protein